MSLLTFDTQKHERPKTELTSYKNFLNRALFVNVLSRLWLVEILHMIQQEKTHMNSLSFSAKVISQLEQ
ncbi:hypothetical protein, partial [Staphylococcus aureus]|uniref:hypothetical protein n=1 Tax=Staphylococcus aureus TaxID=1280 RepID=UPI002147CA51